MADKRTSDAPLYMAQGRDVVKRPVVNPAGGTTMGFRVCTCNEYVDGAAETIADALNRLPQLERAFRDAEQGCRASKTGLPTEESALIRRLGIAAGVTFHELTDG